MFRTKKFFKPFFLMTALLLSATVAAFPQSNTGRSRNALRPVMWEPVNIRSRDLYWGSGGRAMYPNLRKVTFIKKETGGNNLKYRIKDGSGRVWVAKIADESQPETAAVRLLWGIGYKTEINYLVPRLTIPGVGTFKNARLEARPANVDRQDRWSWAENPFSNTKELQGLKIMMALINNWDLKDGNNIILQNGRELQYVVSDLGSAFGKLAPINAPILNRFGRSVNNPVDFANSEFLKGIEEDGQLDFAYKGKAKGLMEDITPAQARWTADLLRQLSARQIRDAFRAANYSPSEINLLTRAVQNRIQALQNTTRSYEAVR